MASAQKVWILPKGLMQDAVVEQNPPTEDHLRRVRRGIDLGRAQGPVRPAVARVEDQAASAPSRLVSLPPLISSIVGQNPAQSDQQSDAMRWDTVWRSPF